MRRYLARWWVDDRPPTLSRAVRSLIFIVVLISLAGSDLEQVSAESVRDLWLSLAGSAGTLVAIGSIMLAPVHRGAGVRIACSLLLVASALAGQIFQPGAAYGQVATFAAVISVSSLGLLGILLAAVPALVYLVRTAVGVGHAAPPLAAGVLLGAVAALLAAYLIPLWVRYAGFMRAQSAAVQERERLAREMHDVLAHTLSGLTVQLEATRLLAEQRPGDPAVAHQVAQAHELAKDGLLEARRAVEALRGDPVLGPDLLPKLLHDFETETGVRCRLSVTGAPIALAPDAQLALYRAAQEALTNIRKHADASSVVMRLDWSPRAAELTVEDRGLPKPSLSSSGFGLTGIRERAALLGGTLDAGPVEGGFRVHLRVPA